MKEYEARRERLRTEREQYLESNLSMLEEREWSSEDNDSYCSKCYDPVMHPMANL